MVFYSSMDLVREIMKYDEKLGLGLDGFSYDQCIEIIQQNCPQIFSDAKLRYLCKYNLMQIEKEYGYRGLRVWYHYIKKNEMLRNMSGDDPFEQKYYNLIPHINNYHLSLLFKSEHNLNYLLYYRMLEEVFKETYGDLLDMDMFGEFGSTNELYHILKTIDLSFFDEEVIMALQDTINNYLKMYGMSYYLALDMTKRENLEELYLHLCEENWDGEAYHGRDLFFNDDGYGNVFKDKWEHHITEDGKRCIKLTRPNITIENFKKVGKIHDDRIE